MNIVHADFGNRIRTGIWACVIWNDCEEMDSGMVTGVDSEALVMECENYNGSTTIKRIPITLIDERIDN